MDDLAFTADLDPAESFIQVTEDAASLSIGRMVYRVWHDQFDLPAFVFQLGVDWAFPEDDLQPSAPQCHTALNFWSRFLYGEFDPLLPVLSTLDLPEYGGVRDCPLARTTGTDPAAGVYQNRLFLYDLRRREDMRADREWETIPINRLTPDQERRYAPMIKAEYDALETWGVGESVYDAFYDPRYPAPYDVFESETILNLSGPRKKRPSPDFTDSDDLLTSWMQSQMLKPFLPVENRMEKGSVKVGTRPFRVSFNLFF